LKEKLEKILPPRQKIKVEKDVDYYDVTLIEPVFEKQEQKKNIKNLIWKMMKMIMKEEVEMEFNVKLSKIILFCLKIN